MLSQVPSNCNEGKLRQWAGRKVSCRVRARFVGYGPKLAWAAIRNGHTGSILSDAIEDMLFSVEDAKEACILLQVPPHPTDVSGVELCLSELGLLIKTIDERRDLNV